MKNLYVFSRRFLHPSQVEEIFSLRDAWLFSRKLKSRILIYVTLVLGLLGGAVCAQAPYQFSYQGVARDASGKFVANSNVTVRIKIHKDGPNGNVIFTETQIVPTNSSGIFNLVIGGLSGGLDNVNWGSDNCFLQTEIDVTGGSSFLDMGTTQLKSVPYALASRKWVDNVPIVQTGVLGSGPTLPQLGKGPALVWYPKKAAFRVGEITDPADVEDSNVGISSFAVGTNVKAQGNYSLASGYNASAINEGSLAIGMAAFAYANSSISIGSSVFASGISSVAIGNHIYAKANGSIAVGAFNNDGDIEGPNSPSDRIFQLAMGVTETNQTQ